MRTVNIMTFKELVQKRMFLLIILILMFYGYFSGIESIGLNKTVGWTWDFSNIFFLINNSLWILFPIGYGILALFRFYTHKNLSLAHLIVISLAFIADSILNVHLNLLLILNLISVFIFFINFIWAIRNRNNGS